MTILFCDLDNTLLYSHRKQLSEEKRCVEWYQGREQSFMTQRSYGLLQKLQEKLLLVPCSTRSVAQYQRISLEFDFPYVLLANGGVLLRNGTFDQGWYQQSLQETCMQRSGLEAIERAGRTGTFVDFLKSSDSTADLKKNMKKLNVTWVEDLFLSMKFPLEEESSFDVAISDSSGDCSQKQEEQLFYQFLESGGYDTSCLWHKQGRKQYLLPAELHKGRGMVRLLTELSVDRIIAAGDSDMDIPLFQRAHLSFAPSSLREKLPTETKVGGEEMVFSDFFLQELADFYL